MDRTSRRHVLLSVGVATTSAVAGCLDAVIGSGEDQPTGDDIPYSFLKTSNVIISDSPDPSTGWIHIVADGDSYSITHDIRICHDETGTVNAEVTGEDENDGTYSLDFHVEGNQNGNTDCNSGTRIWGGASIPNDFESIQLTINDEIVQTMKKEETVPTLHLVPDPIEPV